MKKWLFIIGGYIALILLVWTLVSSNKNLRESNSKLTNNYKAVQYEKEGINREYNLTLREFREYKDSISIKIDSVLKANKIKDKTISYLQYSLSTFDKVDTIEIKGDTIFKDPDINIDTTITHPYYTCNVKLIYPSTVIVHPNVISERVTVFKDRKETIKPRKCWPLRWFQRKQIVVEVEQYEMNKYITNKQDRYIHIIKKNKK